MKIQIFPPELNSNRRIGIKPLGFDKKFPSLMRKIPGSCWTSEKKCWHIPYKQEAYRELKRIFGVGQLIVTIKANSQNYKNQKQVDPIQKLVFGSEICRMEQKMTLQRCSPATIKTYKSFFKLLLAYYPDKHPDSLVKEDLMKFLLHGIEHRNWSISSQNQAVNAIKYYFEKILGQKRTFYELRPRKNRKLPGVFSEGEVVKILQAVQNL